MQVVNKVHCLLWNKLANKNDLGKMNSMNNISNNKAFQTYKTSQSSLIQTLQSSYKSTYTKEMNLCWKQCVCKCPANGWTSFGYTSSNQSLD